MLARVHNTLTSRRHRTLDSPLDRLFNDVITDWQYFDRQLVRNTPVYTTNIDDEGSLKCTVELPGVSSSSLKITSDAGVIHIKGNRSGTEFAYQLALSSEYDLETTKAKIKDGLLTLEVAPYARPGPKNIPLISG